MIETSVVALYIHGDRPSVEGDTEPTPMRDVQEVDVVEGLGIRQDRRYFRHGDPGRERKRQVSLIDEGTIWDHEERFGPIDRRLIKAQIILAGRLNLPDIVGARLSFAGGAEMEVSLMRQPCFAMDLIAPGLRDAMKDGRQGVLAVITSDGAISVGDRVTVLQGAEAAGAV